MGWKWLGGKEIEMHGGCNNYMQRATLLHADRYINYRLAQG